MYHPATSHQPHQPERRCDVCGQPTLYGNDLCETCQRVRIRAMVRRWLIDNPLPHADDPTLPPVPTVEDLRGDAEPTTEPTTTPTRGVCRTCGQATEGVECWACWQRRMEATTGALSGTPMSGASTGDTGNTGNTGNTATATATPMLRCDHCGQAAEHPFRHPVLGGVVRYCAVCAIKLTALMGRADEATNDYRITDWPEWPQTSHTAIMTARDDTSTARWSLELRTIIDLARRRFSAGGESWTWPQDRPEDQNKAS